MPNTAYNASQKKKRINSIVGILSLFLILLIDRVSKSVIVSRLAPGESIPIIKNILHITFVKNTGAAFGLFKNSTYFFITVSVIAVIIIGVVLVKVARKGNFPEKPVFYYSLILIMAGALGNLIDRISLRYVIDFIDVRIWPVFNIAD